MKRKYILHDYTRCNENMYNLERCNLNFCIDEFNSVLELGYAIVNLLKHFKLSEEF